MTAHVQPTPILGPAAEPQEIDLAELDHSLRRPRTLFSYCLSVLCSILALVAAVPLVSVLLMLVVRGGKRLNLALLTQLPPAAGMVGGGIGNAIVGTLLVIFVGGVLSIVIGVFAGVYLAEINREGALGGLVRFCARLLTGLPSILAGVFAYTTVVLWTGRFSPLAGGIALSLLMLPTIILTTEESVRSVGAEMREAAIGMGATQTQMIWQILLPTALPGILTGILLALARGAGETAPLLFTLTFSDFWLKGHLMEPTASLAVLIYNFSKSPFQNQKEIAWAASLVLVLIVLALTLGGQALSLRARRMMGAPR
ncbi:MAG TPA: phosphate ABC transporter permease PstA [Polyangiaceae bacterium]|nr:phosphate ABC transporter permease PstA [Polyangiaceae bacterium]